MRKSKAKRKPDKRTRRPWLPCPACGSQSSEVLRVLRRVGDRIRQCHDCKERFRTTESVCRATGVPGALPVYKSLVDARNNTPQSPTPSVK